MYRSLKALLDHYEAHHLTLRMAPQALYDSVGEQVGELDEIRLRGAHVNIRGWCLSGSVALRCGASYAEREPTLARHDVAKALGCSPNVGFEARLRAEDRKLLVEFGPEDNRLGHAIPLFGPWEHRIARTKLVTRLVGQLAWNTPRILASLPKGQAQFRKTIKTALRLEHHDATPKLELRFKLREKTSARPQPNRSTAQGPHAAITIVLPVFNAPHVLRQALDRIERHTDLPWRLVLIEDRSTDADQRTWLRDWALRPKGDTCLGVELIENEENAGFVRCVNKGFERALTEGGHAVLLHSDTLVPEGWASRLLAPIEADETIATVTPLSNDAGIFSAPMISTPIPLAPGQVDHIDRSAAALADMRSVIETPTGSGFCMAINIRHLRLRPSFDMRLGHGFGEVEDWCARISALGGRHVAAHNLYVEHQSGASFDVSQRRALQDRNGPIIAQRYPGLNAEIKRFSQNDPLLSERLTLALAWLDSCPSIEEVPVFIAHSMGGGADQYLQHRLQHLERRHGVVLRMGGRDRCRVEVTTPAGQITAGTDDLALVMQLIRRVARRRIIYSCAVGDPDPITIPAFLVDLAGSSPLDILFHDFLPLSPSFNLLDADGVYRGVPTPGSETNGHMVRRPNGTRVPLGEWRKAWHPALTHAERLIVFSEDSRDHVSTAYPDLKHRIVLDPHAPLEKLPKILPTATDRMVIGVLGNIVPKKGIRVVQALSYRVQEGENTDLVILGRTDPAFPLHKTTRVHGSYMVADLPGLIAQYKINTWLIPSIWPETFSYVTQECLMTGLPVIAFDLGAQGEAVRRAPNGIALPIPPQGPDSDAAINAILRAARSARTVPA